MASGTNVARTNTLIESAPASTVSATSATTKLVVTPSRTVNTPNSASALVWIVLRPDDRGRAAEFDWTTVAELIRAYEDGADATLEDLERRAIAHYLAVVPMHFAANANDTPDPCDRIEQERAALQISRWVWP